MFHRSLLMLVAVVLAVSLFFTSAVAAAGPQPPANNPDIPIDCGVWAYNPVRSGSNVNGTGEVSCATVHATLRVVAGLRDSNNRYTSRQKYCYNTNYCSTTATLTYYAGRQWQTDVSGYVGSWQAYYASSWVYIP